MAAETRKIVERLRSVAGSLLTEIDGIVAPWTAPIMERLGEPKRPQYTKSFNDPVWGTIDLHPCEVLLLDSPLLQRLRGIRQLGMAHHVYPGATHDRLEHCRGVLEAASRMIYSLEQNAQRREHAGDDRAIPRPNDLDVTSTRIAGLLHDIGHTPFSHATEQFITRRHADEFAAIDEVLRSEFEGVTKVAPSEMMAVLFILSASLRQVFEHPRFDAVASTRDELAGAVAARILGSRSFLHATYLSGVISGPLDADKIDYMARDSHHAGLPLGLDITRLVRKLEVVTVEESNALNPELRSRAAHAKGGRYYEIGIALSALGAYEQMIIARVMLYDRLYYHHKVRAAEAMIRKLVTTAERESESSLTLRQLYHQIADDAVVDVLGAHLTAKTFLTGGPRSQDLSTQIRNRQLYVRAFAIAPRFIRGVEGLPEADQQETRQLKWSLAFSDLSSEEGRSTLAAAILQRARDIGAKLTELAPTNPAAFGDEHVIVDMPKNKVIAGGSDILTRTESGHIGTPNLFFDPGRWAEAYKNQRHCCFVFAPRRYRNLVSIAARVELFERYGLVMSEDADRVAKTEGVLTRAIVDRLAHDGLCSKEFALVALEEKAMLAHIDASQLRIPNQIRLEDPKLATKLAAQLREALPGGMPAKVHEDVITVIEHLLEFAIVSEKTGTFTNPPPDINEAYLQKALVSHLRSSKVELSEGADFGGGESDVLVGTVVIENKFRKKTADPFEVGEHYNWQARRYRIAVSSSVSVVVLAYETADERAHLRISERIRIEPADGRENAAQIRFVVPYTFTVPSGAKAPGATGATTEGSA